MPLGDTLLDNKFNQGNSRPDKVAPQVDGTAKDRPLASSTLLQSEHSELSRRAAILHYLATELGVDGKVAELTARSTTLEDLKITVGTLRHAHIDPSLFTPFLTYRGDQLNFMIALVNGYDCELFIENAHNETSPPKGKSSNSTVRFETKPPPNSTEAARSLPTSIDALFELAQTNGDRAAINALVEIYLPLVDRIAERMAKRLPEHIDLDDLKSEGVLGLMDAIQNFNKSRNTDFKTFSSYRIRGHILDSLRKADPLPRLVRIFNRQVSQAQEAICKETGRPALDYEIAARLGMSLPQFHERERTQFAAVTRSLDEEVKNEGGEMMSFLDVLSNGEATLDHGPQQLEEIHRLLPKLNVTEGYILLSYIYEGNTLREIGEWLGLTESRASQLLAAAFRRLGGDNPRYDEDRLRINRPPIMSKNLTDITALSGEPTIEDDDREGDAFFEGLLDAPLPSLPEKDVTTEDFDSGIRWVE